MKTVYFITSNEGKLNEAKAKLFGADIEVVQKNLGYPEIQANSLEDVAYFGVKHIREKINHPFILEDAGLFIDILDGFPGVYSSYVFHTVGCSGILKLLDGINIEKRKACFRSVFAYDTPGEKPKFFIGECNGRISNHEQGDHGFGYDPIFIPNGDTRTFAQMDTEEKNRFSHRGKSLEKLMEFFKKL